MYVHRAALHLFYSIIDQASYCVLCCTGLCSVSCCTKMCCTKIIVREKERIYLI